LVRTVIYSDKRFSYEEAQVIIETKKNIHSSRNFFNRKKNIKFQPDEITEAILKLDELAKILSQKRMNNGAISFDKVEVKFNLDQERRTRWSIF
jgi:ribonuclease R